MTPTEQKRNELVSHLQTELESALIQGDHTRAYNLKTWLNFVSRVANRAQVSQTYYTLQSAVNVQPDSAQLSLF